MKTPQEIAADIYWTATDAPTGPAIRALIVAGIEADRAQRQEPVHPDWQDDADMYRYAATVDISWRGWTETGVLIGYSDAGISGAQAAAMFEAIGRLEA